jgi:hypothetical protein
VDIDNIYSLLFFSIYVNFNSCFGDSSEGLGTGNGFSHFTNHIRDYNSDFSELGNEYCYLQHLNNL